MMKIRDAQKIEDYYRENAMEEPFTYDDTSDDYRAGFNAGLAQGFEAGVQDEKEIAELKAQIEKMKCCYNCKYGRIYFVKEITVDCLANRVNFNNKYENCNKWELAE